MKKIIILLLVSISVVALFWIANKFNIHTTLLTPVSSQNGFSFTIEADPHMDEQSDPNVFKQTLQNIVKAKPAFLIDLGDIFMVDKLSNKSVENIKNRYILMKSYYDMLGSIPLYIAMGNHDGETGWDTLNTKQYRRTYFPNQTQGKNYYSFEQDNALFIVLDPYMYTVKKPNADGWQWTFGKTQYDWLSNTLRTSKAKYKFVFIHQLVGGDNQGRGGIELAKLYEWGGNNIDGSYGFASHRPGWEKPIHQLLIDAKVNIVFKGHDHLFAKQDLDGLVYQTVPQPSHAGEKYDSYSYQNGKIIGGSGFLNVTVKPTNVIVDFIGATSIIYSYQL
jgi:hypothetical protein